jgi:hypothetical protein
MKRRPSFLAFRILNLGAFGLFSIIPALAQIDLAPTPFASLEAVGILPPSENKSEADRHGVAEKPEELVASGTQNDFRLPSDSGANRPEDFSHPLTLGDRLRIYGRVVVSPPTALGPALGAAVTQWEDEPPEWRQGAKGYGRRFASGYGRNLIGDTISFGIAALDGEDPRYSPSKDTRILARTGHAIASTFVSRREDGTRRPAFANFAGIYGAAFIADAWYPSSRVTVPYALERGSTALASNVAYHVLVEFWPQIKKVLHLKAN